MTDQTFLRWPFFEPEHGLLAERLEAWASQNLHDLLGDERDVDATCRRLVAGLGQGGWLQYAAPRRRGDGVGGFDLRSICLIREVLARHSALADFAFAMQGLGTAAIILLGDADQNARWTPGIRDGSRLSAFALSEPLAGSDAGAMTTRLERVDGGYRLNGVKTWISNGGIADQYIVFAKGPDDGKSTTAVILDGQTAGLEIVERIDIIAPHPMATLAFHNCFVPDSDVIGEPGRGMRTALATLDVFRPSVGAAALGLARRALQEALARASARPMFGGVLADLQLTQAKLADMALDIDAAALLVYRAAWAKDRAEDSGVDRITREAAMAKLFSTEAAQRIIDDAVQLWGAQGVRSGETVEKLYREIRAMRIYEGASEVQKVVIARQLLGR
jgi:alkylation response protein AidB-like acyl-CoA dehydrogenase